MIKSENRHDSQKRWRESHSSYAREYYLVHRDKIIQDAKEYAKNKKPPINRMGLAALRKLNILIIEENRKKRKLEIFKEKIERVNRRIERVNRRIEKDIKKVNKNNKHNKDKEDKEERLGLRAFRKLCNEYDLIKKMNSSQRCKDYYWTHRNQLREHQRDCYYKSDKYKAVKKRKAERKIIKDEKIGLQALRKLNFIINKITPRKRKKVNELTPEQIKRRREYNRRYKEKPHIKLKIIEYAKKRREKRRENRKEIIKTNPEEIQLRRERQKEYNKKYYQQPEVKERMKKHIKKYQQKPEVKKKMRESQKKWFMKPGIRKTYNVYGAEYARRYRKNPHVKLKIKNYSKEYRKRPEKIILIENRRLINKYNITLAKKEEMFRNQNGTCDICEKKLTMKSAVVDHSHRNNKVRSLLCSHCNAGIGFLKDSWKVLFKAATYLLIDSMGLNDCVFHKNTKSEKINKIIILEEQGNKCAICNNILNKIGDGRLDHNHKTNYIRGVLCNNCNSGIGFLKDNFKTAYNASYYLFSHSTKNKNFKIEYFKVMDKNRTIITKHHVDCVNNKKIITVPNSDFTLPLSLPITHTTQ